jgi:hypothetical protein
MLANSTFWINRPIFIKLLKRYVTVGSPVLESRPLWQQYERRWWWWLLLDCNCRFAMIYCYGRSLACAVRVVTRLLGGRRRNRLSAEWGSRFVSETLRPPFGLNDHALQWVVGGIAAEERSWQHLHQVPRWRIYGAILPRPYMSS